MSPSVLPSKCVCVFEFLVKSSQLGLPHVPIVYLSFLLLDILFRMQFSGSECTCSWSFLTFYSLHN